jgi:hypothetical protein
VLFRSADRAQAQAEAMKMQQAEQMAGALGRAGGVKRDSVVADALSQQMMGGA